MEGEGKGEAQDDSQVFGLGNMDEVAIYQVDNRFGEIESCGLCIPFLYIEFEVHIGHSGGNLCPGSPKK